MSMFKQLIRERYEKIGEVVEMAARRSGREPLTIKLLAVTKGQPLPVLQAAYELGLRDFGENYVEEALEKIDSFAEFGDVNWHMIGHLQSRKTRQVCERFSWFQALDRMKIANRLSIECQELKKELPVLLECNVSAETTKFGWPVWDEAMWVNVVDEFSNLAHLPGLQIKGLMTMAPFCNDPEMARPYFRKLRNLRDYLAQQIPSVSWNELSMGMSADYGVAIEEGATIIRVGTALLGARL